VIGVNDVVLQPDMFQRSLSFLESLLVFVEHCYSLERRKRPTNHPYATYEELLSL